jgi:hypothetical protein
VHDVVVGALELAAQRALERLDLGLEIGLGRWYPEHANRALALDVTLITFAHDQKVDRARRRQRTDDVSQLDTGSARPRHRAETGQQDAGHRAYIVGRFDGVRKVDPVALVRYPAGVNRLIEYLRQNLMIDFQGDLSVAKVRELLAGDDSRDAKTLMAKLVAEKNVEDMMLVLADCLLEPVQKSLNDEVMREQLRMYTES